MALLDWWRLGIRLLASLTYGRLVVTSLSYEILHRLLDQWHAGSCPVHGNACGSGYSVPFYVVSPGIRPVCCFNWLCKKYLNH